MNYFSLITTCNKNKKKKPTEEVLSFTQAMLTVEKLVFGDRRATVLSL